jgi:hypothetical protein
MRHEEEEETIAKKKKRGKPSLKPFLAARRTTFKARQRPVPVARRLLAFSDQLSVQERKKRRKEE